MRVIALLLGLLFVAKILPAQAPEKVLAAFKHAYPHCDAGAWVQEGPYFEVHFTGQGREGVAVFDRQGSRLAFALEIGNDQLPAPVLAAAKAQFEGYEIEQAIEMREIEGPLLYKITLRSGLDKMLVIFNAEGQLLDDDAEDLEETE